jgi:6-methylsalicylate decarboxylase
MKHLGVQTAILSAPDPGVCMVKDPEAQAALARQLNVYAASLRDEDPLTFGFLASLPDIRNASSAITELKYALDFLKADGVLVYTRYGPGNVYLGNEFLDSVWSELDARNATVFVHPTHPADAEEPWSLKITTRLVDYPHEITRAALDMVASGTLVRFPNVKVVLAYAGGNLPWLMGRIVKGLRKGGIVDGVASVAGNLKLPVDLKLPVGQSQSHNGLSLEEAEGALRGFWYDLAGSSNPLVLRTLMELGLEDRLVYGVSIAPSMAVNWSLGDVR